MCNLSDDYRNAGEERREQDAPVTTERREVQRRRQIDPTTCERDYSDPEIEFMQALDQYKRDSGRMFPTCSEILEVLTGLGYRRVTDAEQLVDEVTELVEGEQQSDAGEFAGEGESADDFDGEHDEETL